MGDCKLDHLVVAAADLATGREYIEDLLGVRTQVGGRHAAMGTHNRLLRLGDDQYLEIVAVDPDAPGPDEPRWFALDDAAMQARIRRCPALVTWVARCSAIDESARRPPYGEMALRDMARGELRWRMTFTPNGGLICEGALPLLIEWQTEPPPPQRLPDSGCALSRFDIQSPQARDVARVLEELSIQRVDVAHSERAGLTAVLNTPARGEVALASAASAGVES